jgi:murein DD-endopeptidase MepM/ murein hydrolase activator NlpD
VPRRLAIVLLLAVATVTVHTIDVHPMVDAAPCWPPPLSAPVVDPFRAPPCPWCPGNRGIEYATVPGTTVRAVATGRVTFSGVVARARYVVVEIASGWRITYGHLADSRLRHGDRVAAGAVVGTSSERLHLGVRDGERYLDPSPHLGRWRFRPRLVPVDGSPDAGPGSPRLRCGAAPPARPPGGGAIGPEPR